MSEQTARERETWTYAGRRTGTGNKLLHAWIDGSGRELLYGKVRGTVVGSAYEVDVAREGDGISVYGQPRYVGRSDTATTEQIETWRAKDAAAQQSRDSRAAEKRAAADSDLNDALDVVRQHYARLRSYGERRAFIEYVAAETSRPARERDED